MGRTLCNNSNSVPYYTYKLSIPGKRGNALITHVNRVKYCTFPQASVYSVVVTKDSSGSDGSVGATYSVLGIPDLNPVC